MPIYRDGSLLHVPLETRRELLAEALGKVNYPVILSRTFKPADLIRAAKELELEGLSPSAKAHAMSQAGKAGPGLNTN